MGILYTLSPKNSSFTKKDLKHQIYNNFYNIFSPQIKNNINISDMDKMKEYDILSLNNEDNYNNINKNNNKTPRVNNSNNLAKSAVEPKKTFSGFRENRSTHNIMNSDNEEIFSGQKPKKNIDQVVIDNKKLQDKVFS